MGKTTSNRGVAQSHPKCQRGWTLQNAMNSKSCKALALKATGATLEGNSRPDSRQSETRSARGRRTKVDWAIEMEELLRTRYADAEKVILVCDNLNTHTRGAFCEAFPAEQVRTLV